MSSTNVIDDRVSAFIEDILRLEDNKEAFNVFLVHKPELPLLTEQWVEILKDAGAIPVGDPTGSSALDQSLKNFVKAMGSKRASNPKILKMMITLLEEGVHAHVVSSRQVCDALLYSDHLRYEKTEFWVAALKLVRKIIGGVDYKGVREIMKLCIDKLLLFPSSCGIARTPDGGETLDAQMAAIQSLLEYIFDRNAALLPGYFIVNEILKSYPENPSWPHWTLVPMVSSFLSSFRPTAQMVSSIFRHRMRPVVEPAGRAHMVSTWRVDPLSLVFLLTPKGTSTYDKILPYNKELLEPQKDLLLFVMKQLYSKDLVSSIMGVQKPRKDSSSPSLRYPLLEEQLINLFISAMEETQRSPNSPMIPLIWWNATSQLIFFLLYQFVNFSSFIDDIYEAVVSRNLKSSRDYLLWALLQFVSGSIGKNSTSFFVPALKLFSFYDEAEHLPVPDVQDKACVIKLAPAALYMHLAVKGLSSGHLGFKLPTALVSHFEFLNNLRVTKVNFASSLKQDFYLPLLFNTFSTSQDVFQGPLSGVMQAISGLPEDATMTSPTVRMPGVDCMAHAAIEPLSMDVLDSIAVHGKMSLTHNIIAFIAKQVASKSSVALAPALVETYSRLLVFSEIESLGVKGLLNQLLPQFFKFGALSFVHMILEMFCYRLHHIQVQFRLTLLSHLQMGLVSGSLSNLNKHPQLNLCIEATTLKLITSLGNSEITASKVQTSSSGKSNIVLCGESEELNRVVVLTLARAISIHGLEQQSVVWVKEVMGTIMAKTPHSWPSHTLKWFPPVLKDFYNENPGPKEKKTQLSKTLEDEYRTWTSMSNEHDIVQHFSNPNTTIFLCVIWKMLLEQDQVSPVAFKVLERIGAKNLTAHLRSFCDVLVSEFSKSGGAGYVNKCIISLNLMIWKYHIIPLDRLILCMSLRTHEGNDVQVCFFIIQLLLLKPLDFRNRVSELVKTMSPEHQLATDFHTKHLEFHSRHPESFWPATENASSEFTHSLPVYFGNVCLRFIPVFDIVVHRFLELPSIWKSLETLIDHVGILYKFHSQPVTYLYNTLHYYDELLREKHQVKKKLISSVIGALKEVRPYGWSLTNAFLEYLTNEQTVEWVPDHDYYVRLVGRFVKAMQGKNPFPFMDWRFNEFANESAHALYVTCVEIMGLPFTDSAEVGERLLDVVLESHHLIDLEELPDWVNALGIILSNLPDGYASGLTNRIVAAIKTPQLTQWNSQPTIFELFNVENVFNIRGAVTTNSRLVLTMALAHSFWHHAGFAQIQQLPDLVRDKLQSLVHNEEQLIFVYHLVGPFLQRLHSERYVRPLVELTVLLYKMLVKVDKEVTHLNYMDAICDILYHIKYQFTGDSIKAEAERCVHELRPPLQLRLRFIAPGIVYQHPTGKLGEAESGGFGVTCSGKMGFDASTTFMSIFASTRK